MGNSGLYDARYYYKDLVRDDDLIEIKIDRVQVWDNEATYYYIIKNEQIFEDTDQPLNPRLHVYL